MSRREILSIRRPSPKSKQTNKTMPDPQSDYIKNLQQQIYLLELETRYSENMNPGLKNNSLQKESSKERLESYSSLNALLEQVNKQKLALEERFQNYRSDAELKLDSVLSEIENLKHDNEIMAAEKQMLEHRVKRLSETNETLLQNESSFQSKTNSLYTRIEELTEIQSQLLYSRDKAKAELREQKEISGFLDKTHNHTFYRKKYHEAQKKLSELEARVKENNICIQNLQDLNKTLKQETVDAVKDSNDLKIKIDELSGLIKLVI